jgi:hypothetical protein
MFSLITCLLINSFEAVLCVVRGSVPREQTCTAKQLQQHRWDLSFTLIEYTANFS